MICKCLCLCQSKKEDYYFTIRNDDADSTMALED